MAHLFKTDEPIEALVLVGIDLFFQVGNLLGRWDRNFRILSVTLNINPELDIHGFSDDGRG